jgi:hypothetical protein
LGFGERFWKQLSRRITLAGDYEKVRQHRLCKNDQTKKYKLTVSRDIRRAVFA